MLPVSLLPVLASAALAPQPFQASFETLHRLELLPRLRAGVTHGAVTSYDRTGGNDDGFSGTHSFIRKESGGLVLADLAGPGCITRMHTPTPSGDTLEFYIDGSDKPTFSMPYREYFTGAHHPFVEPAVGWAGGGAYSYVPIPYQKSCKVVIKAERTQFYDINYVTYPAGTKVQPYSAGQLTKSVLGALTREWLPSGASSTQPAFGGAKVRSVKTDLILRPGKSITLFESKTGGRITDLRLGPAFLFAGRSRDILLRVTWDGEKTPAINMPVADFFGYAFGKPAMESALVGSTAGENYCRIPMPFKKSAKVELVSLSPAGPSLPVTAQVTHAAEPLRSDEGRFYAEWRRENPTKAGQPFTWLKAQGRGHLIGLSLQGQGKDSGIPLFFEGDDKTIADGVMTVHGTGSEDFFNGGWYALPGRWDRTFSLPLSGCLLYEESTGRTGGYRFMLNDAYPFSKSIEQTIEHGGENNSVITDYTGVAYYYCNRPKLAPSKPVTLALTRIVDPTTLKFSLHSNNHLDTFGLEGFHITRDDVPMKEGDQSAISVRADSLRNFVSAHIGFRTDFPSAGSYRVYGEFVKTADSGIVRLSNGTRALGPDVDLYSAESKLAQRIFLGEYTAREGENTLYFHFVGKNPAASHAGMHARFLICERVP